jgi:hypothetical protein
LRGKLHGHAPSLQIGAHNVRCGIANQAANRKGVPSQEAQDGEYIATCASGSKHWRLIRIGAENHI